MKKIQVLIAAFLCIVNIAVSQAPPGVTVAGGNGPGAAPNQIIPFGVFVDGPGNIYVAEIYNPRVQKWVASASEGTTAAGGNGVGSGSNQFSFSGDVVVDPAGNVYVADVSNHRVQKWTPGASEGITVAGGNGKGSGNNQLDNPRGIALDLAGNLYIADNLNHRIQKWAPGASTGITVAGGNGAGDGAQQLFEPNAVFVDPSGSLYISNSATNEIIKWAAGASSGSTVAGGNGRGTAANQFNGPFDVFVDHLGHIYIADGQNYRVQRWAPGAVTGITVAGGKGPGSGADQLGQPTGIFVDQKGDLFVADGPNHRIQKFPFVAITESPATGIAVAGGNGDGAAANQLNRPNDVSVDASGNVYVNDVFNNRVQKWAPGAGTGITVAGSSSGGSGANQLSAPTGIFVDASGNVYIADLGNARVQKWAPGAVSGVTVAGGNGLGASANQLNYPTNVFVDAAGNIYVSDAGNSRIQKWAPGSSSGTTVAGGNGQGAGLHQLFGPTDMVVDAAGVIYIADQGNHRIQKWTPGASSGVTIAGGVGSGPGENQLRGPSAISFDVSGNLYVSDYGNQRIQRFEPGSFTGTTILGNGNPSSIANQLNAPRGIFVDAAGSIYVADEGDHRVQKFEMVYVFSSSVNGITVAGGNGSGSAENQLAHPGSVYIDATGSAFIADADNHRIQKWAPGALTAVTVAGGNGAGAAANQLNNPSDVYVDASGNLYISDGDNHRIQQWAPGATSGITIAGGNGNGASANQLSSPKGIFRDATGNIYVSDVDNHRIQRWVPGASSGTTVAGGNGPGFAANQLNHPKDLAIDAGGNMFIADADNHRIQKWTPDAGAGIIVAGGHGAGTSDNQLNNPSAVFVDITGNLFIADGMNGRIQKWTPGATKGITVAGGNGSGSAANQLVNPGGVFVDKLGNTFVSDNNNDRIQKFGSATGLAFRYFEGSWSALPDFNTLVPVKTGASPNVSIDLLPSRKNDNFAFIWEGKITMPNPGTYTFETVSDDGSNLYFNIPYSAAAVPAVHNDGIHHFGPATGSVNVVAGGSYPIAITYFEKDGGEKMELYWTGPGIPRQLVPDAAFVSGIAGDNILPAVPANLHTVSTGGNYVQLDWDDAPASSGITFYDVFVGDAKMYTTGESKITADNLSPNTPYDFRVKARDMAGNISGFSNTVRVTTAADITGLVYKYYEGDWTTLPDFNTLAPVTTGHSPNINISLRPSGRTDHFAFVWQGFIHITTPGTYVFETVSDDGSKIYFNANYHSSGNAIVNNDGLHHALGATGTVTISDTGSYPVSITYFENDGGENMQVYWTGPGFARQLIPDAAFVQKPQPPPSNGLSYKYYEGSWTTLPDFSMLTPVKKGFSDNTDLGLRSPGTNDNFGFLWEGNIRITTPGVYTFETVSDDGSKVYFNAPYNHAAAATVNNDSLHPALSSKGTVNVPSAGVYPIAITFFENNGEEQMSVYWTGPGFSRQLIPKSAFTRQPALPMSMIDIKGGMADEIDNKKLVLNRVYPNPFNQSFTVGFYNSSANNDILVEIYDLKGRLMYRQHPGKFSPGQNNIRVSVTDKQLPRGIYLAGLKINGVPTSFIKLLKTE